MEKRLMRIGISLPGELLDKFDKALVKRGYSSRSEGIRDAIRTYNQHYEWMQQIEGKRAASISIVYDCSKKGVTSTLAEIQHEYMDLISSSVHFHMEENFCFEVIILEGDGEKIVELAEKILSLKGVKHARLTTVPEERTVSTIPELKTQGRV
ncbi:nickel-responsive regulator [Methanosarcina sp. 1.H.T.1A.1]|uniref:nickel-responsive transcriptional regulator NikR n=1 Tax=unclassified Methanosarcina TaxID=2644672 RepID=UPI000621C72E|nr:MULTISPECIES: nickel-responsive transcriptional regulator NikR [unclassified Methanosarcina]KKH49767.1 nickel-responsive regulator [Methanosarcina sp. 1.H.A.2.2]KKH95995.1 nickel-responsive regulator [Methanosarcina sp. 1.H.T.1A.1]